MRVTALTAAVIGISGIAVAQPAPPGMEPGRPRLFVSPSGKPYRPTDAQPDGRRAWYAATDLNRDGAIDLGEFRAEFDRFFTELDVNRDGELDPTEVEHYEQVIAPEIQTGAGAGFEPGRPPRGGPPGGRPPGGRRGGGGSGPGGGQRLSVAPQSEGAPPSDSGTPTAIPFTDSAMGASRFGLLDIPEPVASCDLDMNRAISRGEFRAAADRRFKMLDANGDGKLAWDELPRRSTPTLRRGRR